MRETEDRDHDAQGDAEQLDHQRGLVVLADDRLEPVIQRQHEGQVDDAAHDAQEGENPQRMVMTLGLSWA